MLLTGQKLFLSFWLPFLNIGTTLDVFQALGMSLCSEIALNNQQQTFLKIFDYQTKNFIKSLSPCAFEAVNYPSYFRFGVYNVLLRLRKLNIFRRIVARSSQTVSVFFPKNGTQRIRLRYPGYQLYFHQLLVLFFPWDFYLIAYLRLLKILWKTD